ncbi:MAG: hypothetical protein SGARI_007906, partial [Bacillariaceae sp.]
MFNLVLKYANKVKNYIFGESGWQPHDGFYQVVLADDTLSSISKCLSSYDIEGNYELIQLAFMCTHFVNIFLANRTTQDGLSPKDLPLDEQTKFYNGIIAYRKSFGINSLSNDDYSGRVGVWLYNLVTIVYSFSYYCDRDWGYPADGFVGLEAMKMYSSVHQMFGILVSLSALDNVRKRVATGQGRLDRDERAKKRARLDQAKEYFEKAARF